MGKSSLTAAERETEGGASQGNLCIEEWKGRRGISLSISSSPREAEKGPPGGQRTSTWKGKGIRRTHQATCALLHYWNELLGQSLTSGFTNAYRFADPTLTAKPRAKNRFRS